MNNYKFSIPVKINYIADESTISIMTLDDLEEIQEKYSVDLDFVLDEFDYKVDMERNAMDDDDYFGMGENEIFNIIIEDNWNNIIEKLNKEHELNELSNKDVEKLFNVTKENFEKNISTLNIDWSEYISDKLSENEQYIIKSISLLEFNKSKSEFYVNLDINKKLKKNEIEHIKNWLEIQIYDKWGMDFSKIDLSEILKSDNIYVYLTPWSLKKDIKYIK